MSDYLDQLMENPNFIEELMRLSLESEADMPIVYNEEGNAVGVQISEAAMERIHALRDRWKIGDDQ